MQMTIQMTRKAAFVLTAFTALRLLLAFAWPAGIDEAYAISVSQDWSLSYFDHPPATFTIAALTSLLTGSHSASILRIPFVLLGTASAWLIYDMTRKAYDSSAAFWALAWYSIAPFFLISAGLFVVPDGPLDFGLLATLWMLLPAILDPNHKLTPIRYGAAGLFLALSLTSKYQAIALVVSLGLFAIFNKKNRTWLHTSGLLLTISIGLAGLVPVLLWNGSHEWISFNFQAGRAGNAGLQLFPLNFLTTLGGQLVYLLPSTWLVIMACAFKNIIQPKSTADSLFGWLSLILPIAFLSIALVSERSLPHWSMSGFLFGFPLVGQWTAQQNQKYHGFIKRLWAACAVLLSTAAIGVGLQFKEALFTRALFKEPQPIDKNWQLQDWSALPELWDAFNQPKTIVTRNWMVGAKASYSLAAKATIIPLTDPRHFQFMERAGQSEYLAVEPIDPQSDTKRAIQMFEASLVSNGWQPYGEAAIVEQKSGSYSRFKIIGISVRRSTPS